jgi:hypothetical protein
MQAIDLTGTWSGHYCQNSGRHGIRMQVIQRGQSFVGRMQDASTVLAGREQIPVDGGQPTMAEVMSTLPADSTVEGEVEGRVVTFLKSYRGKATTDLWVPDRGSMTFEFPGHQVHYLGTLDATGTVLSGSWHILGPDGVAPQRDRFELRRVEG